MHEHPHSCVNAVLLRLQHHVLLFLFRRQQSFVKVGFPLQLPVLIDEVCRTLREAELLGHLPRLDQRAKVLLQLLQPLRTQPHLHSLGGGFRASGAHASLPSFTLAMLEAVGLELDFIPFVQDGLQLQVVLKGAGDVERSGAVLHGTLRRATYYSLHIDFNAKITNSLEKLRPPPYKIGQPNNDLYKNANTNTSARGQGGAHLDTCACFQLAQAADEGPAAGRDVGDFGDGFHPFRTSDAHLQ